MMLSVVRVVTVVMVGRASSPPTGHTPRGLLSLPRPLLTRNQCMLLEHVLFDNLVKGFKITHFICAHSNSQTNNNIKHDTVNGTVQVDDFYNDTVPICLEGVASTVMHKLYSVATHKD